MPRNSNARSRTIGAAATLFRRNGYAATGLNHIVEEAHAPRGSLYYYFPGGKEELAIAAIEHAAAEVNDLIEWAISCGTDNPQETVVALGRGLARWLVNSNFEDGCPIATIALETAHINEPLRSATHRSYTYWIDLLTAHLVEHGHGPENAARLARTIISGLEGSLILARCACDATLITETAQVLAGLVA